MNIINSKVYNLPRRIIVNIRFSSLGPNRRFLLILGKHPYILVVLQRERVDLYLLIALYSL